MSIPAAFVQFKSAGVYRIVYDKSTVLNQDTEIMRLVVGYSPQGPFNIPVLVRSISEFKALFGEPSKSLEKRGVFFHKIALQALLEGPILCMNLKRFSSEVVEGATIDTGFNPDLDTTLAAPIDVVELAVEDIYDTTRFWELSAFKLAEIRDVSGRALDGYISLCATNTKNTSTSFFIRKASGQKVAAYNVSVNDWYKDSGEEVPEFLQDKLNNLISDFFAEIYFFKGEFTADQVLTSETLKRYFMAVNDDDNQQVRVQLRPYVINAYGEPQDTLDALFEEPTSGALTHYIGCLIPYFKDKQDVYKALDIMVNNDIDTNNVMMNFNVDMLEDGQVNIDLSGRSRIPVTGARGISTELLYNGEATSTLLGNVQSPIISDIITFDTLFQPVINEQMKRRITGNFYVENIQRPANMTDLNNFGYLTLEDLKYSAGTIDYSGEVPVYTDENGLTHELDPEAIYQLKLKINSKYWYAALERFGITETRIEDYDEEGRPIIVGYVYNGGLYKKDADTSIMAIPEQCIVAFTNYLKDEEVMEHGVVLDYIPRTSFSLAPVAISSTSSQRNKKAGTNVDLKNVYGSSVSFVPQGSFNITEYDGSVALTSLDDAALVGFFAPGDCLLAADGSQDADEDGEVDAKDGYYDNVFVQEVGNDVDSEGVITYYVKLSGEPFIYQTNTLKKVVVKENSIPDWVGQVFYIDSAATVGDELYQLKNEQQQDIDVWVKVTEDLGGGMYAFTSYGDAEGTVEYATGKVKVLRDDNFLIRIDSSLNQEIGVMLPVYLEGYTYANPKPASTSMYDKQKWQDFILSTLTDYKGIRTGLLNKADSDYRYVIDTFESFVTAGCKNVLSFLCKEKQSAFAILNFPSIRNFVKCPYTSFTDNKGIFNPEFVVKGFNPKKSHTTPFTLPADSEGASFCAFYTPVKFSDGYIDSIIPSAGLVSNLFIEKYRSRQPYYIVAGPNYGAISASQMTGPDYNFSREELNILEPFGVNCMVYRPGFGTFINANQTAKQTPRSSLSSINVRELVIYLQDEIEKLLQSYQWEFNNQTIRNKIKDKADVICSRIQNNGGIIDFVNIMDESNNTPEIIDNEMAVLSTHIEPGRGMGKMIHELTLYRTGQMRAAISEA